MIFYHRMHDRLRMNHHLDLPAVQVEQPAGLDDLQGLVHQRGRVDGDFRPHVPGGMGQGLGDGHLGQLLRPCRCGTARRWPSTPRGGPPRAGRPAWPGKWRCARCRRAGCGRCFSRGQASDQRPGHHQALLVGQGHRLAGLQGRPGPLQPGAADNRRNHHVDLRRRSPRDATPSGPISSSVSCGRPDQSCRAAAVGSVATIQRGLTARACCSNSARLLWAVRATARRRPPEAAITSSVLRPMLPVEPRMADVGGSDGHAAYCMKTSAPAATRVNAGQPGDERLSPGVNLPG